MRNVIRLAGLAVVTIAATSCGDAVRQGSSPVYLVIDSLAATRGGSSNSQPTTPLLSDVVTNVKSPAPCTPENPCPTIFDDIGSVTFHAPLKDIGTSANPATPTPNNEVTITRYTVRYTRTDGRNTEGVDVPYAIDGAATFTFPSGDKPTPPLSFEIVRHTAKQEAPLAQLRNSPNVIYTNAIVTFYGTDRVGNAISAQGQIQINFGNFGDF